MVFVLRVVLCFLVDWSLMRPSSVRWWIALRLLFLFGFSSFLCSFAYNFLAGVSHVALLCWRLGVRVASISRRKLCLL